MRKSMNCLDPTQVELFVHGGLSDEGVSQLEEHLNGCESCLALVARVAGAARSGQLSVRDVPPTDSTWMHVMAALARSSGPLLPREVDDAIPAQIGPYRVVDV